MVQVLVHIYRVNFIYCDIVIGHNMHYRGCASYWYLAIYNTHYILLLLTKNNIYTLNIKLSYITVNL